MSLKQFTLDTKGQAYTIEAIIALLLLIGVILFVAPSFATPTFDDHRETVEKEHMIEGELENIVELRQTDGWIKASILNYDDDEEEFYDTFPAFEHYLRLDELTDEPTAPNLFAEDLIELEDEHDVRVEIFLVPESDDDNDLDNPDRISFVESGVENVIASTTTTVTLYNDDRLRSHPHAHSHLSSATPRTYDDSDQPTLLEADNYPVPPHIGHEDVDDGNIYNIVTVKIMVYEPAPAEGE